MAAVWTQLLSVHSREWYREPARWTVNVSLLFYACDQNAYLVFIYIICPLFSHLCCVCLLLCSCCHGNNSLSELITQQTPKLQGGTWQGTLVLIMNATLGLCDCTSQNSWHLLVHLYSICTELNAFHVLPHNPAVEDDMFPNVSCWEVVSYKSSSFIPACFHVYHR